jgi:glycosyltransferase involved in cell wall biosynthesis
MNNPLVSIIIPSFNRAGMIRRAIDSALNQTYKNIEIILVDDASTDNTKEVIDGYGNEKIRYLKLNENHGQCYARNRGMEISRGQYIGFLDSDDEWLPLKLEKQLECFAKGDYSLGAVYGYAYEVDERTGKTFLQNEGLKRGYLHDDFLKGYCPATPSLFLVRRDVMLEVNMFDENLITFVDLDLWLRISKKYTFDLVDAPIIRKYEHSGEQYVSNFNKRAKGLDLLLEKWGEEIKSAYGADFFIKLQKERIEKTVDNVLLRPPKNYRDHFSNIIKYLIKVRSSNLRLYFKALVVFIIGPRMMNIYYIKLKRDHD